MTLRAKDQTNCFLHCPHSGGTGLILRAKDQTALVPLRMVVGRGSLSNVVNLTAPDRRDTDIYICSTILTVRCFAGRAGISVRTNISISAIILWSANEMLWLGICTSTTSVGVAPATFGVWFEEGAILGGAPSTLKALFVEGSMLQGWTFLAEGMYQGRFWVYSTNTTLKGATTDRQAGLSRSPAQSCRVVAAGDALEATEKGPHNLRI